MAGVGWLLIWREVGRMFGRLRLRGGLGRSVRIVLIILMRIWWILIGRPWLVGCNILVELLGLIMLGIRMDVGLLCRRFLGIRNRGCRMLGVWMGFWLIWRVGMLWRGL